MRTALKGAPVTGVFLALCVAVYALMAAQALGYGGLSGAAVDPLANANNVGWELMLNGYEVAARDQWWRVLTAAVVHLNLTHLLLNAVMLAIFGRFLERELGSLAMLGIIVASAAGGSAACLLFNPSVAMGGASTVAYGLMVAYLVWALMRRQQLGGVVALIVLNVAMSVTLPNVSIWGHMGGFLGGAVAAGGLWLGAVWGRGAGRVGTGSVPAWVNRDRAGTLCLGVGAAVACAVCVASGTLASIGFGAGR